MTKIALLGAGGKMGVRLATNLQRTAFDIAPVEVAEAGRARLKAATGLDCLEEGQAL
jgi:aspartate-semialdehyde dehydrogenase